MSLEFICEAYSYTELPFHLRNSKTSELFMIEHTLKDFFRNKQLYSTYSRSFLIGSLCVLTSVRSRIRFRVADPEHSSCSLTAPSSILSQEEECFESPP